MLGKKRTLQLFVVSKSGHYKHLLVKKRTVQTFVDSKSGHYKHLLVKKQTLQIFVVLKSGHYRHLYSQKADTTRLDNEKMQRLQFLGNTTIFIDTSLTWVKGVSKDM